MEQVLEYNRNEDAEKTLYSIVKIEVETQSVMLNRYYDNAHFQKTKIRTR